MNVATLDKRGNFLTALIRQALHRIRRARPEPFYPTVTMPGELPRQLSAARIRTAVFPTVRRGYHPEAVRHLLTQLADEITRLHKQLARVYAENDHIKTALKQWQTEHAATCRNFPDSNHRDWPVNPAGQRRR